MKQNYVTGTWMDENAVLMNFKGPDGVLHLGRHLQIQLSIRYTEKLHRRQKVNSSCIQGLGTMSFQKGLWIGPEPVWPEEYLGDQEAGRCEQAEREALVAK